MEQNNWSSKNDCNSIRHSLLYIVHYGNDFLKVIKRDLMPAHSVIADVVAHYLKGGTRVDGPISSEKFIAT